MDYTPYYLFLDFDDTLLLNGKVPNKTTRALKRAKKAGCKIYMNSARSRGNLMPDLKRATNFEFDGYLCAFTNIYLGSDAHERHAFNGVKDIFERAITLLDLKESDKFIIS